MADIAIETRINNIDGVFKRVVFGGIRPISFKNEETVETM